MHYSSLLPTIKLMPDSPQVPVPPVIDVKKTLTDVSSIPVSKIEDAKSIIEVLFMENVITQEQYDEIKVKSALTGESRESILESMHIVSEDDYVKARAKLFGIPFISLTSTSFSPQALSFLPKERYEKIGIKSYHIKRCLQ